MGTLKLPAGRVYSPKRETRQVITPVHSPTTWAPQRKGHAASSIRFDPFRAKNRAKHGETRVPSVGGKTRPEDVPIKRRNTPLGAAAIPARWSAKKNKEWEPSNEQMAANMLPADILEQTICNIKRKDLALAREKYARPYPVVDPSRLKPVKPRNKITQIEKGMPPERKAALRLLRKWGLI